MIKVGHYNFFIIYKNEWNNLSKNGDVILNRAIDYSKNDKERLRDNARDNTEIHLKKKKIKRENMEEIDIILFLKKWNN